VSPTIFGPNSDRTSRVEGSLGSAPVPRGVVARATRTAGPSRSGNGRHKSLRVREDHQRIVTSSGVITRRAWVRTSGTTQGRSQLEPSQRARGVDDRDGETQADDLASSHLTVAIERDLVTSPRRGSTRAIHVQAQPTRPSWPRGRRLFVLPPEPSPSPAVVATERDGGPVTRCRLVGSIEPALDGVAVEAASTADGRSRHKFRMSVRNSASVSCGALGRQRSPHGRRSAARASGHIDCHHQPRTRETPSTRDRVALSEPRRLRGRRRRLVVVLTDRRQAFSAGMDLKAFRPASCHPKRIRRLTSETFQSPSSPRPTARPSPWLLN